MSRCVVKSVIKTAYSKARPLPVFPATPTQPSTLEHWGQIAPRAITLSIGIRQATIYRIQNLLQMKVEAVLITAMLLAANAIHPLCNRLFVPTAMKEVLKAVKAEMIR